MTEVTAFFNFLHVCARARIYFNLFLSFLSQKIKTKKKEKMEREKRGGFLPDSVERVRNAIRIGDWLAVCMDSADTGKKPQIPIVWKGRVKAKYPYLVEAEMEGRGSSRMTVTYVEILMGEVKWKEKENENDYTI